MKTIVLRLVAVLTILFPTAQILAQDTAFTYQGRLNDGTNAASGTYNLRFALFDALTAGSQIGSTLTNSPVIVTNGFFTVTLNFGNQFPGANRWLEIGVRTNGGSAFSTLTPRQPLTPTPYAITASNLSGTLPATQLTGTVPNAQLSASVSLLGASIESVDITDGTIAAADVNAANFNTTFWRNAGNAGTTPGTHFLGTTDNQPLEIKANGLRALRVQPGDASGSSPGPGLGGASIVGGYNGNSIALGLEGATIAGGGGVLYTDPDPLTSPNTISGPADFGTISGGRDNTVSQFAGTVGGGERNRASQIHAVVAGGFFNTASGEASAVGGGESNTASGRRAAVPGGDRNVAAGTESFAAGRRAKANHAGTFVWADSTDADFTSTANNQFLIRAGGGVGIGTANPGAGLHVLGSGFFGGHSGGLSASAGAGVRIFRDSTTGVGQVFAYNYGTASATNLILQQPGGNVGIGTTSPSFQLQLSTDSAGKPNGGSWANSSDARVKKNIQPLSGALEKLTQLRGVTFEWVNPEDHANQTARQGGFVAQEVERVFPHWVTPIPAAAHDQALSDDGKIKSLTLPFEFDALVVEALKEQQQQIKARDTEIGKLKQKNAELETRLGALEKLVNHLSVAQGGAR